MELTARKKEILKILVDSYIATAEPLGSKAIAERMAEKVSSATVRNELADLSEMGYLEQPHTSAGRIPSAKGYRLYVNELMERKAIDGEEADVIRAAMQRELRGTDQLIARTGQMVSSFMDYPTYAVTDHREVATIRRFELLYVDALSVISVVMLSDSRVKSTLLHMELPLQEEALQSVSPLLNTHFTGLTQQEMHAKLMNLTDQVAPENFLLLNRVVDYAADLLEETSQKQVYVGGASQLLKIPEFRDLDKAHDLMHFMSDSSAQLPIPAGDTPMQILIGPENVSEALKESSVVVASYDIGDGMRGLVGVVGPTRMDYAAVAARLSFFAESLTKMFGKAQQLPPKEEQTP